MHCSQLLYLTRFQDPSPSWRDRRLNAPPAVTIPVRTPAWNPRLPNWSTLVIACSWLADFAVAYLIAGLPRFEGCRAVKGTYNHYSAALVPPKATNTTATTMIAGTYGRSVIMVSLLTPDVVEFIEEAKEKSVTAVTLLSNRKKLSRACELP